MSIIVRAIGKLLRGLGFKPAHVGAARGVAEGAAMGAISGAAIAFGKVDLSVLGIPEQVIPVVVFFALAGRRTAEGVVDGIDPAKKRAPEG
jgi:hypothetical protein